jgi:hypothetical protein
MLLALEALPKDLSSRFQTYTEAARWAHLRISLEGNDSLYCSRFSAGWRGKLLAPAQTALIKRGRWWHGGAVRITDEVFQVGGPQLTAPDDAAIYLVR